MDFLILGPFEVRREGEAVAVGGAKVRALLAMLVLHAGEPVSAERLAIALWGEEAPAAAVKTVHVYVSRLRRALGENGVLETTPAGYRLRTDRVDALHFERLYEAGLAALAAGDPARAATELRAALALWRGPALADFAAEGFAQAEIARLEEQQLAAVEARVDADLATGRHRELVGELERHVAEQPLRERAYGQLMRALAGSGRQAEALEVYRLARSALVNGLGLEPGAELRELERRILAQEEDASPAAARVPRPPTPTIGREGDLARLRALLTAHRLVTIVGPGGVGKTRLAIEAASAVAGGESARAGGVGNTRPAIEAASGDLAGPGGVGMPRPAIEAASGDLAGPGGVGMPRPAIEAASGALAGPGGVGMPRPPNIAVGADFVSLAAVADAGDVASAIVRGLGLSPLPGESMGDALVRRLERREALLVLDNFEHVLEAAELVAELLALCPRLRILVTSREPLRLRAEHLLRLEPLALGAAVEQFSALVESRDHALGGEDLQAAREICRRLDGLPLAIELAAGRIGVLSVPELAARLQSGFDALGPGARDAPARQRTLAATLEWSYALATPDERVAFSALAVFAGGCTLEAAEAVTEAPFDVLDSLVAKHLVVARDGRLTLLETVREFALARAGEDARRRHAEHFAALAERAGPELQRTSADALLGALDLELENFRAALAWAVERREAVLALRLASSLRHYWLPRNLDAEGTRWLKSALALDGAPDALRAEALQSLTYHLAGVDTVDQAEAAARESLALRRALGDEPGCAAALCALAWVRLKVHRVEEAYALACEAERCADERTRLDAIQTRALMAPTMDEALAVGEVAMAAFRAAGNLRRLAKFTGSLGYTALFHDDAATALRLSDQALAVALETGDAIAIAIADGNAALAALMLGDLERARAGFARELRLADDIGYRDLVSEALGGFAAIAAAEGRDERAAELHGAAEREENTGHDPVIAERLEARIFAPARERLGAAAWATAAARLDRERAIELAAGG